MRSHQSRFDDAFKKLQQEVKNKAANGKIKKRKMQLPETGLSKKVQPPKGEPSKKRKNYRSKSCKKSTIKIAPPVEKDDNQYNPRLKNKENSFVMCKSLEPHRISAAPRVDWEKIFPGRTSPSAEELLGSDEIECFAEMPPEEVLAMDGEQGIRAFVMLNGFEWTPCTIIGYDCETNSYNVELERGSKKTVNRKNLRFESEMNFEFNNAKLDALLDNMEDKDYLDFLSEDFKKAVPQEILDLAMRIQKICELKGDDIPVAHQHDPSINAIQIVNTNKEAEIPLLVNTDLYRILIRDFNLLLQEKLIYFGNYIKSFYKDRKSSIADWHNLIEEHSNTLNKEFLDFSDEMAKLFLKKLGKILDTREDNYQLRFTEIHPYYQFFSFSNSNFNRFRRLALRMLREFAQTLLDIHHKLLIEIFGVEWNQLHFQYLKDEDFKCLDTRITVESTGIQKPLFILELGDPQEEVQTLCEKAYSIVYEALTKMINPFALIFNKCTSRKMLDLRCSQYELFINGNNFIGMEPRRNLFNDQNLGCYFDPLFLYFKDVSSTQIRNIYSYFPQFEEETMCVFEFFEDKGIPTVPNVVNAVHKLCRQRSFFILNFPSFVNLGFAELNMSVFKSSVYSSIENYRLEILDHYQRELDWRIEEIQTEYAELLEALRSNISSIEEWSTMNDTLKALPGTRERLEQMGDVITDIYNALYELRYGLGPQTMRNYENVTLWPVLLDIEAGKAIAKAKAKGDEYQKSIPTLKNQIEEENTKTIANINKETDEEKIIQSEQYLAQLQTKKFKIDEISQKLEKMDYNKVHTARTTLWNLIAAYQAQIKEWGETTIGKLNSVEVGSTIHGWQMTLRRLTLSFRKEAYSLRLLISTKNDIEFMVPIYKGVAQITSDKLKPHHKVEIQKLIGFENYEEKTPNELVNDYLLKEKLDEINTIFNISKFEEKADIELIHARNSVFEMNATIENNLISNTKELDKVLREQNVVLKNIISSKKLADHKLESAVSINKNIGEMIEVLRTVDNVQEIIKMLSPLQNVTHIESELAYELSDFNRISSEYQSLVLSLKTNPNLLNFSRNKQNMSTMRGTLEGLQFLRDRFIDVIASFRLKFPRLCLVPDGSIINSYATDVSIKMEVLCNIFPGTKSFIEKDGNLVGLEFSYGGSMEFLNPVNTNHTIFEIIPLIETEIPKSLRSIFFAAVEDPSKFGALPFQLMIIYIYMRPNTIIPDDIEPILGKRLQLFKNSLSRADRHVSVSIEGSDVYITAGNSKIRYGFQVASSNTYLFSPQLHEALYDVLLIYTSDNMTLIHSASYSLPFLLTTVFSFLCGRYCLMLHTTANTSLKSAPEMVRLLDTIGVWICIDEVQLMNLRQIFEMTVTVRYKFFAAITSNSIPSILQVDNHFYSIKTPYFLKGFEYIMNELYPNQKEDCEFLSQTISKYVNPYLIYKLTEQTNALPLKQIANFQMIIPPEIIEKKYNEINSYYEEIKGSKISVEKTILSTIDFVNGFESITREIVKGTKIMLITGPRFSGTSTCISTAALSLGYIYKQVAFTTEKWPLLLAKSLEKIVDKPTVAHVLLPFSSNFIAHSASMFSGSLIPNGETSLLAISDNITIIFEMMTQVVNPQDISIPIVTFSLPLVQSSELLEYWIVNKKLNFSPDQTKWLRQVVSPIIQENALQLSIFFNLLSTIFKDMDLSEDLSLSTAVAYCLFWSGTYERESINEWIDHSNHIKQTITNMIPFKENFHEMMISNVSGSIGLASIYQSKNCSINSSSVMARFTEGHVGPICMTNIPTPQFVHAAQQIPLMLDNGYSVLLIGPKGSGKTTVVEYIASACFNEPQYTTLSFNGETITDEELYTQILSASVITVDGVVVPRGGAKCVVVVDPAPPTNSDLFGSLVSIIKTGNAVIEDTIRSFKNFRFLITSEEPEYQLLTCCYPIRIVPWTKTDVLFFAQETLSRIVIGVNGSSAQATRAFESLKSISESLFTILNTIRNPQIRFLHFVSRIVRSATLTDVIQSSDMQSYFLFMLQRMLPGGIQSPIQPQSQYELMALLNRLIYQKSTESPKFLKFLIPRSKLFSYNFEINEDIADYVSFVCEIVQTPHAHAFVVNDMRMDYETVTKFACSIANSKFVVLNDDHQISHFLVDGMLGNTNIVVFCRHPSKLLLTLATDSLKTTSLGSLKSVLSNKGFLEKVDNTFFQKTNFPFANLDKFVMKKSLDKVRSLAKIETEKAEEQAEDVVQSAMNRMVSLSTLTLSSASSSAIAFSPVAHKVEMTIRRAKPTSIKYLSLHMMDKIHVITVVQSMSEITNDQAARSRVWDHSHIIPQAGTACLKRLISTMLYLTERSYVDVKMQCPKILARYDFIMELVKNFIKTRKKFVKTVLSVIKAIEVASADNKQVINQLTDQINMDNNFLDTYNEVIKSRLAILDDINKDLETLKGELAEIAIKDQQYSEYIAKDSEKTMQKYNEITKIASKAFTQDEQYKLYIQQNPNETIKAAFNAFCTLREFTPREDGDFWPEARGILKQGRFGKLLKVFDPSTVKKDTSLLLDVALDNPLLQISNFSKDTPIKHLVEWLHAVKEHTKCTHFNPVVNHQINEHMKQKLRKEQEQQVLLDKKAEVQNELELHLKNKESMEAKIAEEKEQRAKFTMFYESSTEVAKSFPAITNELQKFTTGETVFGKNIEGFVLKATFDTFILPLFPVSVKPSITKKLNELLSDSFLDSNFFVTITDIIGNDEPIVISLLAGDRVIACFDPHRTTMQLLKSGIPSLARFDFVFTSTENDFYHDDVVRAAEDGKVLVIDHADAVVNDPFLNSIGSPSVTTGVYHSNEYVINSSFRVIFLLDRVPSSIMSHVTFMDSVNLSLREIESILIGDDAPSAIYSEMRKRGMVLHSQRENLYHSLSRLTDKMAEINTADSNVLDEVKMQATLMHNASVFYKDSTFRNAHSMDGREEAAATAEKILETINLLQDLQAFSPMYVFPLSKLKPLIEKASRKRNVFEDFAESVVVSIAPHHRWTVNSFSKIPFPKEVPISKVNIIHFGDISKAVEFYRRFSDSHIEFISISSGEFFYVISENVISWLSSGCIVAFNFFEPNSDYANELLEFIRRGTDSWSENSSIFIAADTSYMLPAPLVIESNIISLDDI